MAEADKLKGNGQPAKKTPNDYIFGKMVGEGSFSTVYLAKDVKSGKEFAIKVCEKAHIIREKKAEYIRREKEAMTLLSANVQPNCPFFVKLYATFQDPQRLYFVMSFAYGGELLGVLREQGRFSLAAAQFYGAELVWAVAHLHRLRILHRDLKPENILLSHSAHILITDFGSAKILQKGGESGGDSSEGACGPQRKNSFVGTAQYVSPEVLQGGQEGAVGPPADLWAVGCILYQFLTGETPFQAPNEYLVFRRIINLDYSFPEDFHPDAKDIISKLLRVSGSERLGAAEWDRSYPAIQAHPFFAHLKFERLHCEQAPLNSPQMQPNSTICGDYSPGFDSRVIAQRFLQADSEESLPWGDTPPGDNNNPTATPTKQQIDNTVEIMNSLQIQQTDDDGDGGVGGEGEETLRRRLQEQQQNNPWHSVVQGRLIFKQGIVCKRKGLFSRKRMLVLTEGPRLFYCDPHSKEIKGEIPFSPKITPEAKDFKVFHIHTGNRTYYLEDPEGFALSWCQLINTLKSKTYKTQPNQGGNQTKP